MEGFTAILDAEDQPAWLKGVALHFAVVASREFDDAAPAGAQQRMPTEKLPADAQTGECPDSKKQVICSAVSLSVACQESLSRSGEAVGGYLLQLEPD